MEKRPVRELTAEEFTAETGLPAMISRKSLVEMGGRHYTGNPFRQRESTFLIELIVLERNCKVYLWKRQGSSPSTPEDIFKVHAVYDVPEIYNLI